MMRIRIILGCFILFVTIIIPSYTFAEVVYYIDATNGNDSNDGLTPETAWRTIEKVNNSWASINPGDNILLKRGETFTDARLDIKKGGTESNPLTVGAYGSGTKPTISNSSGGINNGYANIDYVIIQDIHVKDATSDQGIAFGGKNHHSNITISRCTVNNIGSGRNGILIANTDTYIIEDCAIYDCSNNGIVIYGSATYPATNGIIRRNVIHDIVKNDGITLHENSNSDSVGPNHQILDNEIYNCGEDGIDLTSGSNVTAEGNETYGNGWSGIGIGISNVTVDRHYSHDELSESLVLGGNNTTVKNSIIYNSGYHSILILSSCSNLNFYHNTVIWKDATSGNLISIVSGSSDLKFKNNIFASTANNYPGRFIDYVSGGSPSNTNSDFDYNQYYRADNDSLQNLWYGNSFGSWQSSENQDANSYYDNPDIVDVGNEDFRIHGYSLCVDAGMNLGVSYDYENRTRPAGSGYDIGAYEYEFVNPLNVNISGSPTSGEAPLAVNFNASASGGTSPYSYIWNFGDGTSASAQNPSHTYSQAGTYSATLTVTDSNSNKASDSLTITASANPTYNLTISSATGSPAPSEGGTTDPSPGNHSYSSGRSVQVKAIPNTNYRFSNWSGDVSSSDIYIEQTTITMNKVKSIDSFFCTKCGDVNGDLSISPADAQSAFNIFLSRLANPTKCEKENADVNSDGTKTTPNITPADAQAIFNKFLGISELPSDCSGHSRAGSVLKQTRLAQDVNLITNDIQVNLGEEISVPIIVENPLNIKAFGFDFLFPSEILEFVGMDRKDLQKDFDQIDANKIADGVVRVGGYRSIPIMDSSPRVLITLIFRVIGELKEPASFTIIKTVDDIKNASFKNGMLTKKPKHLKDVI